MSVHIAQAELRRAVHDALPTRQLQAAAFANALEAYVDAKCADAVHQANKTGEWSPEY